MQPRTSLGVIREPKGEAKLRAGTLGPRRQRHSSPPRKSAARRRARQTGAPCELASFHGAVVRGLGIPEKFGSYRGVAFDELGDYGLGVPG